MTIAGVEIGVASATCRGNRICVCVFVPTYSFGIGEEEARARALPQKRLPRAGELGSGAFLSPGMHPTTSASTKPGATTVTGVAMGVHPCAAA